MNAKAAEERARQHLTKMIKLSPFVGPLYNYRSEDCFAFYVSFPEEPARIGGSTVILVSKQDARIVFFGSVGE